jgi:hypothetical protein
MITFRGVLAEDVDAWWPWIMDWVRAALEHGPGLYAPDDVLERLRAREMQLWVACEDDRPIGCVTTSIERFPRKTALVIGVVGGESGRVRSWIRGMDELLRAFAAHEGCDAQLSEGRPGWDRFIGNGWRKVATQYLREL